ncbi:hypothetical protein DL96DRAFT_1551696 [Flagelloscypha sp. PMI_526]|nr:hypothetical protein DL96DRAFT_1551696 [Flagelloscypha sp. PMI_526]
MFHLAPALLYLLPFLTLALGKGGGSHGTSNAGDSASGSGSSDTSGSGTGSGNESGTEGASSSSGSSSSSSGSRVIIHGSGKSRYCVDPVTNEIVPCPKEDGLSTGAIIAIVVSSVVAVIIIGVLVWWILRRRRNKKAKAKKRNVESGAKYEEVKDADSEVVQPLAPEYQPPTGGYTDHHDVTYDAPGTALPPNHGLDKKGWAEASTSKP